MRRLTVGVAIAVTILVAGCGGGNGNAPASSTTTATATSPSKPPIAQAALSGLLLTPAEIDTLLGVTGSASKDKIDKLQDDSTKQPPGPPGWKFPDECVYTMGPAEAPVYAGSGNTAVSGDADSTSLGSDQDVMVGQVVVLFPSAKEANDFFTTSAQRWPACADRQINVPGKDDGAQMTFKMGPFANTNRILSITQTTTMTVSGQPDAMTVTVQRALTARNNVVVDVVLMRKDPADLGVKVAAQIAAKIDKQQ
ncbi:sensor domain-containing protein [Mycobacterium stomatepiae]|uniref:Sensor domain-containing protein n=1 Tax=Mycobacterium stomatepiae TaxID=470076 RepID=A0A7I7Q1D1_9MYCO|nr:sensor domain-containing protein [Mycobacterium stomatepiae]MCV7166277.1 sensor domain-containing protein [Mycobacterium stomatepiae]BBY19941.1 sensor domain-containing protein [Mycobacterium stomatepiae]